LLAVALPNWASVREPVVPPGDSTIVSVVIAMVMFVAPVASFTNVRVVPTGYATEALAGIVKVAAPVPE
jgi:hypothetical protein